MSWVALFISDGIWVATVIVNIMIMTLMPRGQDWFALDILGWNLIVGILLVIEWACMLSLTSFIHSFIHVLTSPCAQHCSGTGYTVGKMKPRRVYLELKAKWGRLDLIVHSRIFNC